MHSRRVKSALLAAVTALATLVMPLVAPLSPSITMPPACAQGFLLRLRDARRTSELKSTEPLVLNERMRKPLRYFKEALDERWRPVALFIFCLFIGLTLSILPFKSLQASRVTMRESVVKALTYSFIYSFLLMVLARCCFEKEAMLPLGLLSMGILEASYTLGLATGIMAVADRLCEIFKVGQDNPNSKAARLLRFGTIVLTCLAVALLSAIPGFGMVPRIGNRLVLLLGMLGLGGILREQYRKAKA